MLMSTIKHDWLIGLIRLISLFVVALISVQLAAVELHHGARVRAAQSVLAGLVAGDAAQALADLTAIAAAGDKDAAAAIASAKYSGSGVARDREGAIEWWQRAHDLGHKDGAYNVGLLLLRQPENAADGLRWLRVSSGQGHALACFVLGTALAEAQLPEDHGEAITSLECAARSGYAPAQYNLATVLARNDPSAAALVRARAWYEAAAVTFDPARIALQDLAVTTTSEPPVTATPAIHDREWVMTRQPENFTIQAGVGATAAAVDTMLSRYAAEHDTAGFLHRPNTREPFSAIIGSYSERSDAKRTLAALPPALKNNAPWIRSFATLQRELEAAADGAKDGLRAE